jgi:putative transposase
LLELSRYVVLNPLRAKMVRKLENYPWSSYLATCGQASVPTWLHVDAILSQFSAQRARAIAKYVEFVHDAGSGKGSPSVWSALQGQIYLGSEAFLKRVQKLIEEKPTLDEVPKAQQRARAKELKEFAKKYPRDEAIARAFLSGHHTMASVADFFHVHYTTVSRLVKAFEATANRGEA